MPFPSSTIEIRVRYKEADQMGRVYHSNYLVWYDIARTEFLRQRGCSYKKLEEEGIFFVVAEVGNKYLGLLEFDDIVLINTTLTEIKNVSVTFSYDCINKTNGKIVSKGFTKMGIVDKSGKIAKIPQPVLDLLK